MEDVKKWTVTYTKHLKQKRKVYQDGFLHIHSSTRKVMLYDDSETLLVSRLVKTDDTFRSGETVTFATYLVDIGDPHGDLKPSTDSTSQGTYMKINDDKARSLHGRSFKINLSSTEGRKTTNLGMKKVPPINLSPSQKVIREFKKNEFGKYRTSPTCPDTTKTSVTEWQVLYTTQITQKTKRFHDGTLKVVINGLQATRAMLYDSNKGLLDSKFLKKHELVRSGESLTFDGHLVEIGECEGEHKPPQGSDIAEKTEIQDGAQGQTQYTFPVEWVAMYTTQVTQKAKNYHSGILRLVSCGSYRMQAILLGEDGTTLGRKYLELSKEISNGSTLELPGYLVEVGELRKSSKRGPQNDVSQENDKEANVSTGGVNSIVPNRRSAAIKLLHGKLKNKTSPIYDKKPCVRSSDNDDVRCSERLPTDKPLRNAQSIMSILRKPMTHEGTTTITKEPVDSAGESQMDVEADKSVDCIIVLNDKSVEPINLLDSQPIISNSSSFSYGSEAPHISRPIDEKFTIMEPQVLNALNSEPDGLEVISTAANSSLNSGASSEEVKSQKTLQVLDAEDKNSEEYITKAKNTEFPSFDIGF